MKTILPFFICAILFFSCSKNNDNSQVVTPDPVVTADTLTSGWTKIDQGFADIFFVDNLTGYGIGDKIYKTTDGGNNWLPVFHNNNTNFNVSGTNNGKIFLAGGFSKIYSTSNGGVSFDSTILSGGVFDFHFPDNTNGYAIANDALFQTSNAGANWTIVQPFTGIPANAGYRSLFFRNSSTGWIIANSTVYRMNGSINNWSATTFDIPPTNILSAIYASSVDTVYVVSNSGQVFKSIDGGVNFSQLIVLGTNGFADVHFIDNYTGYVSCGNKIYKTTDGGISWQAVVTLEGKDFVELYFTDSNHGWGCAFPSGTGYSDGALVIYKP